MQYRRLKIVHDQRLGHAAKMPKGVFQDAEEVFGRLAVAGFAIALARMRQYHPQHVGLVALSVGSCNPRRLRSRSAPPPRLTFHPPKRQRPLRSQSLEEPPHAVVADRLGTRFAAQVLMNPHDGESLARLARINSRHRVLRLVGLPGGAARKQGSDGAGFCR